MDWTRELTKGSQSETRLVVSAYALLVVILTSAAAPCFAATTELVSVTSMGTEGDLSSGRMGGSISADGRYVTFDSNATNLVAWDGNGVVDVFCRDLQSGVTLLVSRSSAGEQGNSLSYNPRMSRDGAYIVFQSHATNLIEDDTNSKLDIFRVDVGGGSARRVSEAWDGAEANALSANPAISAYGRYVAFDSEASNLVYGDTNGVTDVFVRDMDEGIVRASVTTEGAQGDGDSVDPSISPDGRYVVFTSYATNLVPNDTNGETDVFVHDLHTGATTRVSVASDGTQGDGDSSCECISNLGRYVCFESLATNLVPGDTNGKRDIFLHDCLTSSTSRISLAWDGSEANGPSFPHAITSDGRYISFFSDATNLVPDDTNGQMDVFVRDLLTGVNTRVSVSPGGLQGNADSGLWWGRRGALSDDGLHVLFVSEATNLATFDDNGEADVFVRHLAPGGTPTPGFSFDVAPLALGLGRSNSAPGTDIWGYGSELYVTLADSREIVRVDIDGNITPFCDLSEHIAPREGPYWPTFDIVGNYAGRLFVTGDPNTIFTVDNAGNASIFASFPSSGWDNDALWFDYYGNFNGDLFLSEGVGGDIYRITTYGTAALFATDAPGELGAVEFSDGGRWEDLMYICNPDHQLLYGIPPEHVPGTPVELYLDYEILWPYYDLSTTSLSYSPGGVWGGDVNFSYNQPTESVVRYIDAYGIIDTALYGVSSISTTYFPGPGMFSGYLVVHEMMPGNIWLVTTGESGEYSAPTPVGSDVQATLGATVTAVFDTVSQEGMTTMIDEWVGPAPPPGLEIVPSDPPLYREMGTTAVFAETVTVCVTYDEEEVHGDEFDLRLLRYDEAGAIWEDITSSVDVAANEIRGTTLVLSRFIVVVPSATAVEGAFYAHLTESGTVLLRWTVPSLADIDRFDVYRATSLEGPFARINESALAPASPGRFEDSTVWPDTEFWYELRAVMSDGSEDVVTGSPDMVRTGGALAMRLAAPTPNPFRASTAVSFDLPDHGGSVELGVYDVSGRRVKTLVQGAVGRGRHYSSWDGTDDAGRPTAAGIYFMRLQVDGRHVLRKVALVR